MMEGAVLQQNIPDSGEDSMQQFLQDIRRYPRLSPDAERQLAMKCAEGDADAIKQMVVSNLQLVVSIAKEYVGRGVPVLDLIQEGSIGLIAAARKFDYTRNLRFSTYATKWIRQGVARCVMDHNGLIRVPHYTAEKMNKVLRVKNELTQQLGTEPTVEQIAEQCDMEEGKVSELLNLLPKTCSLDSPIGTSGEDDLQVLIEDLQAPQPQEELVRRELKNTLAMLMSQLNDRQQQVLRLHYGMDDGVPHSLESISKQMGISKERVRQIERQARDKLKIMGADFGLEDFLSE